VGSEMYKRQAQEGAFRVGVAVWVHADGHTEEVPTFERLKELISAWGGGTPERESLQTARQSAQAAAAAAVKDADLRAQVTEDSSRNAQISAARGRLMREVCRYLLARYLPSPRPDGSWLNRALYEEMGRISAVATRFKRAFELLGGYPDWDQTVIDQMNDSVAALNEARRSNILSLTTVDAALADPRWAAISA
jgi:hypothetical protein